MRVLHAYNQHRGGGGADNATRATIEASRRRGLELEVFTRSSQDLPADIRGRLVAASSVVYSRSSVRSFGALLDSFRPDLVHAHELFPLVSPWILPGCAQRGVPVVMSCPDYRLSCPVVNHFRDGAICTRCSGGRGEWAVVFNCRKSLPESLIVAFYNRLVRHLRLFSDHVTRYLTPSDFTRRWLIDHARIDPERIAALSPLVEQPAERADPAAGRYVAYAGRLSPEKGIDTLMAAARLADVPLKLSCHERSLVKIQVPAGIEVVVTRTPSELSSFYRGARVLAMPSLGLETFGLVAAEAMAHGIPVVASRRGPLVELVDDGVEGLLFEPGDVRDLAAKLSRLWTDAPLAARMGRAARAKAACWSEERHVDGLLREYETALRTAPRCEASLVAERP